MANGTGVPVASSTTTDVPVGTEPIKVEMSVGATVVSVAATVVAAEVAAVLAGVTDVAAGATDLSVEDD